MNLTDILYKLDNAEKFTFDFVGDSVTHGLNHCTADETYVAKFAKFISEKYNDRTVLRYDGVVLRECEPIKSFEGPITVSKSGEKTITVIRNGVGGDSVRRAINRIENFTGVLANNERPDVTFLMFGINDALKSNPTKYVTPDVYIENYKELISKIKDSNPETDIIILAPTTNGNSVYNHYVKLCEFVKENDIPFIDTHKLWLDHYNANAENYGQGDWLVGNGDACHPTPLAAEITAKFIFDEFMKLIQSK